MSPIRRDPTPLFRAGCSAALVVLCAIACSAPVEAAPNALSLGLAKGLAKPAVRTLPTVSIGPAPDWQGRGSSQFYAGHFLPELKHELGKIGHFDLTGAGQPISAHAFFDDYTKQARRRMERATQDSLQDYLLETTALGKVAELFNRKSGPGGKGVAGREFSLGLGVSSAMPQAEMRYKMNTATLRVSLGFDGATTLDFKTQRMGNARVVTRFDPTEHEYGLACRLGF